MYPRTYGVDSPPNDWFYTKLFYHSLEYDALIKYLRYPENWESYTNRIYENSAHLQNKEFTGFQRFTETPD